MHTEPRNVALGVLLVLLAGMFYPALMLGRRLAPEASLRSVAPWRQEWGPNPEPRARVLAAATQLGPRLAVIEREGLDAAVWNPWIGGGRPGWLSAPREGGAPLPLAAGLLARPEWAWSALVALTVGAAFTGAWLAARWLGASAWGAAAAGVAYALAGPVAAHWLDWRGSALALGPFALLPALAAGANWRRHAAAWALAAGAVLMSGPPGVPFVALAVAFEAAGAGVRGRRWRLPAAAVALALVLVARFPVAWLEAAGGETGARPVASEAPPPVALMDLVRAPGADRHTARALAAIAEPALGAQTSCYLGLAAVILAGVGMTSGAGGQRRFWGAVIAVSLLLAALPAALLVRAGVSQRPLGVLALAVAVLAAAGVDALCRRTGGRAAAVAGAALCAVLVAELAPAALRGLPFATDRELQLAPPLAFALPADGSRIVTMVSALPPDVAASYSLADIRARSYEREPAYEELIRSAASGPVQALDPELAALGARWVLEPTSLRLVSGIVFGDVSVVEAQRVPAGGSPTSRYLVVLPADAGRIGLPRADAEGAGVFLQGDSGTAALEEDRALAEESATWRWFGVPPDAPRTGAVLGVMSRRPAPPSLSVAVDTSGLRIVDESPSLRVWEWARAVPFARLDEPNGLVRLIAVAPARIEVETVAAAPATLVVQVKHRPGLWRAEVDGRPVATVPADRVWTGLPVPAGTSRVVVEARLPRLVWLPSLAAVIMIGLLGLSRRTR